MEMELEKKKYMVDHAGIMMGHGTQIAAERVRNTGSMDGFHYHTYYELYLMEEGTRTHMMKDATYVTNPGDIMLFTPYTMHRSFGANDRDEFQRIVLYFTEEAIPDENLRRMLREAGGLYHPGRQIGHQLHGVFGMLLMEQNEQDELHDVTMKTLLCDILLLLLKNSKPAEASYPKSRISEVVSYLDNHYMEDIHLDDLASHFYISTYYLCHEFKKYTKRTVNQYLNVTRILNAQRLIMETNASFTEVAQATGFASSTNFSRVFRAVTGMTPSQFRKSMRERSKNA